MAKKDADRQLNYVRALRIRLLGDRVLQNVAWKIADQVGWPDTLDAEYVALTQLQADAFITLDAELAHPVKGVVVIAPIEALSYRKHLQMASATRGSAADRSFVPVGSTVMPVRARSWGAVRGLQAAAARSIPVGQ
jgi:hypothetical protein